ncbi:ATP-binding protein [Sphingomonas sp. MS122]|uniref:ATP-binding protein n=1 Tax=Sphingomonas sp. MS122 TaxID=3412683 RepID=UPI003C2C3463
MGHLMLSEAKLRAISLIIYLAAMVAVQAFVVDTGVSPNENAIWLYSGIASLLLGSRIVNPYFTPPADTLTNAFAALLALVPALSTVRSWTPDAYVLGAAVGLAVLVAGVSLLVLILRPQPGVEPGAAWRLADRAVKGLGTPNVIFSLLILASVWLFHRDKPIEIFAILGTLFVIVLYRPLESLASYVVWFLNQPKPLGGENVVGTIAAHQSPGIVLVRQVEPKTITRGTPMVISDQHGPAQLGVALNYVGRDEGNLLRVLTVAMPNGLAALNQGVGSTTGDGIAVSITVSDEQKADIRALQWIDRLCGIVDTETSPEYLQFEVINEAGLGEGSLAEVRIGDHQRVIYQVVDGVTRDEVVQQKNKYGYARAKARKIGTWDDEGRRFCPVPWMPRMNAPVFLLEEFEGGPEDDCIGHFPATPYGVRVDPSECVTHNTAILGILGVGKSYLAIELVERMIARGIKVVCLDLTNQYENLLADFVDPAFEEARRAELLAAGEGGVAHQNKEQGGSRYNFKRTVFRKMREFMAAGDDHFLWVINPAQFRVTKQVSGMYNNTAELAHLTASEITSIFSDAALFVCQELGMTDEARLCLVYEEAHSLVPEWNSVAAEGDKMATATSARAILQGRKYGLGCLLITQRTANVTKTILNQCNTIFAMRTFDDTGKEFLGNYIGSDYAAILPSMQPRHAVVFGKASSCENPVLIRLNDQNAFRARFRPDNPPKRPEPVAVPQEEAAGGPDAAAPEGGGAN